MNVAFYIEEMNFRGVANSTYSYALNNSKILKNKSIIFFNKKNTQNKNEVIKKFKKSIMTIGVSNFKEIDFYKEKFKLDYLYIQKSGNKDNLISTNIKTLVHVVFPQGLNNIHGDKTYIVFNQLCRMKLKKRTCKKIHKEKIKRTHTIQESQIK